MRIGDEVRAILDQLPHVIWIAHPDGEVHYLNRYGCVYMGVEPSGMDWRMVMHPDDIERVLADLTVANEHRWPFRSEYRVRRADGEWRWHVGQSVLVSTDDGDVRVGTGTDIQDRVDLEHQLRVGHKMQAVGSLASGVAHEFNNLLTMILANAALLSDGVPADLAPHVDEILQAGQRGAKLTRQLQGFARRTPIPGAPLVLDRVVASGLPALRTGLGPSVELREQLCAGNAKVFADAAQLQTIVVNLVMNARDAMVNGGAISIATSCDGNTAKLAVADPGTGFDDVVKARVFDPFFTTKRATNAAGLGLTIVQNLVRELGGTIDVDSAPGIGSRFTISIPCIAAPDLPDPSGRRTTRERAVERNVLVVHGSDAVLRALSRIIGSLGYRTLTAHDAPDALALLGANEIHVALVEAELAGMTGLELAAVVQSIEGIGVILMGDGPCPTDATAPYLQRPFSPNRLAETMREVLFGPLPDRYPEPPAH